MIKRNEILDQSSCWNKACMDEPVFVLLGRDKAAAATIRYWCELRVKMGTNKPGDPQIVHAEEIALRMEGN